MKVILLYKSYIVSTSIYTYNIFTLFYVVSCPVLAYRVGDRGPSVGPSRVSVTEHKAVERLR